MQISVVLKSKLGYYTLKTSKKLRLALNETTKDIILSREITDE